MTVPLRFGPRTAQPGQPYDVAVVGGAGHVGLPLALVLASKGLSVLVHDVNAAALATIGRGELPAMERGADTLLERALADGMLALSDDPTLVGTAETVVITIGTPIDEYLDPVHDAVAGLMDALEPYLRAGQFLVLRSTVFPGTTQWLHDRLKRSGLDVLLAFCPERVVQGNSVDELQSMPQIVSGTTPEAAARARALFGRISRETIELTPIEAELAKLFNNSYRYIQFAITNQLYMIANSCGADYYRILNAMTHNYPRARDMARPGFSAGPCLFKDTMQLAAFAPEQFNLGRAAMQINEGLVLYMIDRLKRRFDLGAMTVGLLGMAFKADSDDIRASLSYKLKKYLSISCRAVLTTDPLVRDDPDLLPLEDVIARSDLLILCAPHTSYKTLKVGSKPLIDIWNAAEGGQHRI